MVRLIVCIYFLLIFLGCGKQKFPDYDEDPDREEEQASGYYTGIYSSLNSHYAGSLRAHSVLWTKGQQFYARVVMMKGTASVIYQQYIHKGSACPSMQNDFNGDGILSADEAAIVSGPMLIPLDRNLKTQELGREWFPRTDREGIYYYSRSGDISEMMRDLRKPDSAPDRGMAKLNAGENLDMERRTIILYRSSSETFLPVGCAELKEDFDTEYQ